MVENNNQNKKNLLIILITLIIIIVSIVLFFLINKIIIPKNNSSDQNNETKQETNITNHIKESAYKISNNTLQPFDLYFLQIENEKANKIYSPLSIKSALAMLNEGTAGTTHDQISNVLGKYEPKKYINSKNMSFANSFFIKDTYKESVNDDYIKTLKEKYNAEIKFDNFTTPNTVNAWINDKTLGLIDNVFDDISEEQILLINSLAIDMDWEDKFIEEICYGTEVSYEHENFGWWSGKNVEPFTFDKINEEISGMEIVASFNKYDIVNVLGEENIRKTVKKEFEKYLQENPDEKISDYLYNEDITGLNDEQLMEKYLDKYIEEINSNYKKEDKTTDFDFYVDEEVKVFSKDLKEYDGIVLQYIGIMPTNENLDNYIKNITITEINNYIKNLKSLKIENFNDGVVTKINGSIPKFKFDYELKLLEHLKTLGITDVFESGANLNKLSTDKSLYINNAKHKSNIEFTQDGIKASATTAVGGWGAGELFDYNFDVPVEEIDLTFDKPYMFIIRDKNSEEVWFVGTVYNPLLYSEDNTIADCGE